MTFSDDSLLTKARGEYLGLESERLVDTVDEIRASCRHSGLESCVL